MKRVEFIQMPHGGRIELYLKETKVGHLEYEINAQREMIVTHTFIDKAFGGQGLGVYLVEQSVAFAKREGFELVPLCPFASKVVEKLGKDQHHS